MKAHQYQSLIGTGVGLVFAILTVSTLIPEGYRELKKGYDSLNWPTAEGVVTSSEITRSTVESSSVYHADVHYKYTVGEKLYISDRVSFGQYDSSDPRHANSIVNRYGQDQKIRVYFNPISPEDSVIVPGVNWWCYLPLSFGLLFAGIGIFMMIEFGIIKPRQWQKRTKAFEEMSVNLELTFCEDNRVLEENDFEQLPLFKRGSGREISNILSRDSKNGKIFLFDYEFQERSGESDRQYRQTVTVFQRFDLNLPAFSLQPENFLDKVGEFFGRQDIDFGAYPEFSQNYRLQGELESEIRSAFNAEALQFFTENLGWSVECGGQWLVIYRFGRLVEPENLGEFLQETSQISELFALAKTL
jgi:hypothetical protein